MSVNGNSAGSVAKYLCLPGWEMKGSDTSTCGPAGAWSPAPACVHETVCSYVYCVFRGNHHVEVLHHRGELHGHQHQCNYNAKDAKCTCMCWM